jgi:hypothetical protein
MSPDALEVRLYDALIGAFSIDSMTLMLRNQLGIDLENELDVHRGKKYIFSDLLKIANQEGWRDDLVRGALIGNTGNLKLRQAAQALGISKPSPSSAPVSGSVPVKALDQGRLEKIANERGVTIKFTEYGSKLNALAHCMCLIEVPTGTARGTGWLVSRDLVLTNYHVIEDVQKSQAPFTSVTCRFDYFEDGTAGVACGLADPWLVDWSPYALADENANSPDPTPDELDYALLRLARPVGEEALGSGKRGWIAVLANPPVVLAEDLLMVPQFPDGRSLELSFGKALVYNKSTTRLRYDANTDEGASGSPAMTMSIEPFGLHHAGGPGRSQKYNQCVPLRLVIRRMAKDNKVPHFWQGELGGEK